MGSAAASTVPVRAEPLAPMTRVSAQKRLQQYIALAGDREAPVYPSVTALRDLIAHLAGVELQAEEVATWPLDAIPEILAWLERNPREGRRPKLVGQPHVIFRANICSVCGAIVWGKPGPDRRPTVWKLGQLVGTDCVPESCRPRRRRARKPKQRSARRTRCARGRR